MNKKQEQLASLADLALSGVKITICATRKAPRQVMRSKGGSAFIKGGNKPIGYTQSAY